MKELYIKTLLGTTIFCIISLSTIICYWFINNLWWKSSWQQLSRNDWNNMITNIDEIKNWNEPPSWTINSFELTICPIWWTEYLAARWRFIRWIDSTWTNDVVRVAWDIQIDDFKQHWHKIRQRNWYTGFSSAEWMAQNWNNTFWATTANYWWTETRPKNVALLYCQKN